VPVQAPARLTMRAPTELNFRHNLQVFTGRTNVNGFHAHHVLPKSGEFRNAFARAGIRNVHEPRFGAWVPARQHLSWSAEYNRLWRDFFNRHNWNATQRQVFDFARGLGRRYGFAVRF